MLHSWWGEVTMLFKATTSRQKSEIYGSKYPTFPGDIQNRKHEGWKETMLYLIRWSFERHIKKYWKVGEFETAVDNAIVLKSNSLILLRWDESTSIVNYDLSQIKSHSLVCLHDLLVFTYAELVAMKSLKEKERGRISENARSSYVHRKSCVSTFE